MCFRKQEESRWGTKGVYFKLESDGKLRFYAGPKLLWVAGLGASADGLFGDLSGRYWDVAKSPNGLLKLQIMPFTARLLYRNTEIWSSKEALQVDLLLEHSENFKVILKNGDAELRLYDYDLCIYKDSRMLWSAMSSSAECAKTGNYFVGGSDY